MKQLAAKTLMPTKPMVRASKRFIKSGTNGIRSELRQTGPGEHAADLLGVVALRLAEIFRQDIDRAEQREADQNEDADADAEIAPLEQAQVDQRLLDRELDGDEGGKRDRGDDAQAEDEGRGEPVVLVAFLEHGLQRRQGRSPW